MKINLFTRLSFIMPLIVVAVLATGCGASYGSGGGMGCLYGCPATMPPPVATDCSATAPLVAGNYQVGLNLALGVCNDTTYGAVRGYTAGGASSQVIKAPANSNIVFINNDALYNHTADFLASALPFPATYGMGVTTARATSPAATVINASTFSTGTLAHSGGMSLVYKVPAVPGTITLIGDFFYYGSGVRTVVIAQ